MPPWRRPRVRAERAGSDGCHRSATLRLWWAGTEMVVPGAHGSPGCRSSSRSGFRSGRGFGAVVAGVHGVVVVGAFCPAPSSSPSVRSSRMTMSGGPMSARSSALRPSGWSSWWAPVAGWGDRSPRPEPEGRSGLDHAELAPARARARRLGLGHRHPQVPLAVERPVDVGLDRVIPLLVPDALSLDRDRGTQDPEQPDHHHCGDDPASRTGRDQSEDGPFGALGGHVRGGAPSERTGPRDALGRTDRGHDARSPSDSTARSRTLSARRLAGLFGVAGLPGATLEQPDGRLGAAGARQSRRTHAPAGLGLAERGLHQRSSSEWYDITASRPPGASTASAPSRASASWSSSRLTSMRMAWKVRFAG